jgi:metal-responsive CopG/Arc/MetJ family transcriptional regulator
MDQVKTYRPIHINMESGLLFELDRYKGEGKHRSQLVHEAIRFYLNHLDKTGVRPKRWIAR